MEASLELPKGKSFAAVRFRPRRLGHSNNFVDSLEPSMQFWVKVAGFEEVARELQIPAGFVSNGNTHHDLGLVTCPRGKARVGRDGHMQMPSGRGLKPGLNHLGWEMENEKQLVEAYERFAEADLPLHRLADHQTSHSVYIFDPDGILHEIYADAVKEWRTVLHGDLKFMTGDWNPKTSNRSTEANYHATFDVRVVPDAAMHPIKLAHEVLVTKDYESMVNFYTKVIGLDPFYTSANFTCFGGALGLFDLALARPVDGIESGMHHMAFLMADEKAIDDGKKRLAERGIEIVREIDNDHKRSIFLRDPDGMGAEFFVPRNPSFATAENVAPAEQLFLI